MFVRTIGMQATGIAILLILAHGCRDDGENPLHCNSSKNDGDAYCNQVIARPGDPVLYCEQGTAACITPDSRYGCVERQPKDECYSPCGGRSILAENGECIPIEDPPSGTSTGETSIAPSTSDEGSTTGGPCVADEHCNDPMLPFCVSGQCVDCDGTPDRDAACSYLDPAKPVCMNGACVQCTDGATAACTGMTPICDEATNTCVPCTAHDQCGEAACNLFTGACLPSTAVVHVGPGQSITSLVDAVESFAVGAEGTIIVHGSHDAAVTVDDRTLAFLAADDATEASSWIQTVMAAGPQLTIESDAIVIIDGVRISGNVDDVGVQVSGGGAWIDRSDVSWNRGGGINLSDAQLVLWNSFVGGNGFIFSPEVDGTRGINAQHAALDVRYTTIAANVGPTGSTSMACDLGTTGTVRNSIVMADGNDTIACGTVSFTFDVVDTIGLLGSSNSVRLFDAEWFPNIGTLDFHIDVGAPFEGIAQWQAGDPLIDIDGQPRPAGPGNADYVGADLPDP